MADILNRLFYLICLVLFSTFSWLIYGADVMITGDRVKVRNGFGWGNIDIPMNEIQGIEVYREKIVPLYLEVGVGRSKKIPVLARGLLVDALFKKANDSILSSKLNLKITGY